MGKKETEQRSDILDYVLSDDGLFLLEMWTKDGYTLKDICRNLNIAESTLWNWRKKYPQVEEALAAGKEITDYKVENALLKCALGYKTKEVKTTTIMRYGKVVETQTETLEKEQPPNIQAITMWLCNREKKKWNTPNSRNLLDEVEEDSTIQVTVTRASNREDEDGDVLNESVEISKGPAPESDDVIDEIWVDDDEWAEAEMEFAE